MEPLDEDQVRAALDELRDWEYDGSALSRQLRFDGFREAIDFVLRVADLAESADHHPELTNVHSRVGLVLTTHEAGGVTDRDLDLARAIDTVIAG